jgi:uncharacterized protein YjiS (DUF1127 family)
MTAITFDTLAYAKRLRDAGISEPQAEAQASALAEALKQSAGELATQAGLAELRQDLRVFEERTDGRFKLLQWMIGFNLALTLTVLFLLLRH